MKRDRCASGKQESHLMRKVLVVLAMVLELKLVVRFPST